MRLSDVRANAPTYRFWGRTPPKPGHRAELVDLDADVSDGTARMRLYDPIDSWGGEWGVSAKEFAAALDSLPDGTDTIELHVNSPGGEVFEAIAITNLLRGHSAALNVVVDGIAASAASFLAASADDLTMGRNSELMVHDAWGLCMGNAADMAKMGDTLSHLSDNIASVYAEKSGGTVEDWRAVMVDETWFSADEAVAAGLADRVEGEADQKAQDKFDLSVFAHAGRADAPAPAVPAASSAVSESTELSALQQRRHRMNARKLSLPA